jgi:ABC-type uncharacterized transport system substrate-binding protein
LAAETATRDTIFTPANDQVELGLVASLNRAGGNVSPISVLRLLKKRPELLHKVVPGR